MTADVAVDTSVAVPLLVQAHDAHRLVTGWAAGRSLALSGHALVETYSVLTRLPAGLRLGAEDACRLLEVRFDHPLVLDAELSGRLHGVVADRGIAGGAVYDALVALAAREAGVPLATRDARARPTYEAIGAQVLVVA